jgi:exodeoxyribonuclease VII large subunit
MRNADARRDRRAAVAESRRPAVMPVSLFVSSARLLLERQLGLVWIGGEISGVTRAASGHLYFTLKDASAQVRCVFFRHKAQGAGFALREGLAVEVRAVASIYEPRGDFQLNVETIRRAGQGALYERFIARKRALEAAGLFDSARKRALPAYPRRIGIVTSRRAAALRDVLTTLARRAPGVPVVLYPAPVQGIGAASEIAAAIRLANAHAHVDVLIVCRGGGSLEDLWAFNEEAVARAVFDSRLPVVSGVGHETDFTICDFVADVRAATPTAAATLVAPDRVALCAALAALYRRRARAFMHRLGRCAVRLDIASRRLVHPAARLALQSERAQMLGARLARAFAHRGAAASQRLNAARSRFLRELRAPLPQLRHVEKISHALVRGGVEHLADARRDVERLAAALALLNPSAVLDRGYAIVTADDGRVVSDARDIRVGDDVRLTLAKGAALATVNATEAADERDDAAGPAGTTSPAATAQAL